MKPIHLMRICRLASVTALSLLLLSCAALRPVPAYDALSDAQLTSLYVETIGFVEKMIEASGTPEGTFEANRDFYIRSRAVVDTLTVRAQTRQSLGGCPPPTVINRALAAVNAASAAPYLETTSNGDCQLLLLTAMRRSYQNMATFHSAQGDRGIPSSARGPLLDGGVGAILRAAIAVELARSNKGMRG